MENTVEQSFVAEYTKRIKEKQAQSIELVSSHVLPPEEYAAHVGRIRMCNEALDELDTVKGVFFPDQP